MSVLSSLSGYQMYRVKTRERVHGPGVVRFLLADEQFPRACVWLPCVGSRKCCTVCPNSGPLLRRVARMRRAIHHTRFDALGAGLSCNEFIDRLQVSLARTNDETRAHLLHGHSGPESSATRRWGEIRSRQQECIRPYYVFVLVRDRSETYLRYSA